MRLLTLTKINLIKFIKLNYLSSNIKRTKRKYILPYKKAVIDIDKSAIVEINETIVVNDTEVKGSKREAILFLRSGAKLSINGRVNLKPGATIQVQKDATLTIGKANINYGATIIAANNMKIGNGILISRNVVIFDSDFHNIINSEGEVLNSPRDVQIGDHVWIGAGTYILRGSQIGDGAVIAAGSVVGGKVKSGTMASGNPARSYSDILWEE